MSRDLRNGAHQIASDRHSGVPVVPFLLGTAVGGLAGAVIGTLLSGQAAHLLTVVVNVVERRDAADRGRPKFEWMVQ